MLFGRLIGANRRNDESSFCVNTHQFDHNGYVSFCLHDFEHYELVPAIQAAGAINQTMLHYIQFRLKRIVLVRELTIEFLLSEYAFFRPGNFTTV